MNVHLNSIAITQLPSGFHQLIFDLPGARANIFNRQMLQDLSVALDHLNGDASLQGLVLSSAKDDFALGADVTAFSQLFSALSEQSLTELVSETQQLFNRIEDLSVPTVCLINGQALGGAFELALAADFRLASLEAKLGLPEVKLGIYPGWGGTVRLPRLIGIDNANQWICGGEIVPAAKALANGAVDALVESDRLLASAQALLKQCVEAKLDYRARRTEKQAAVRLSQFEQMMAFESAKALVKTKAGPHYPAPLAALKSMQKSVNCRRDQALAVEVQGFTTLAQGPVCQALVGVFLKDQALKKRASQYVSRLDERRISKVAVIGAGTMGAAIAGQSQLKGATTCLKDVTQSALLRGKQQIANTLNKGVKYAKLTADQAQQVQLQLTTQLDYQGFEQSELIIEAALENQALKTTLLAEVEQVMDSRAILTTNTSTLSIDLLAQGLTRAENFCGLHFFNPVERMPLVEIIRGKCTSERTIERAVAFAQQLGKKPVVVNDCPGFLVNRVLFPYFFAFNQLLQQGVDFRRIDRLMLNFGWPMGPAHLLDVVGVDVAFHASKVMAQGFAQRMSPKGESALAQLTQAGHLGEKTQSGFYCYQRDRKGKNKRIENPEIDALISTVVEEKQDISDQDIQWRMMIPLLIEAVRCLEEQIVEDSGQLDIALIYGIGFPPFLGGALSYIDTVGLSTFIQHSDRFTDLGPLYEATEQMREMQEQGKRYSETGGAL